MTGQQRLQFEQIATWSQVVCAILFIIFLVWVFRKYLMPGVLAIEASRNADLLAAEKRRDAIQTDVSTARAEVEAADRDAVAIVARARAHASAEHERILADAKADGELTVRNARGELERGRLAASSSLRADFIEKALQRARKEAAARIDDGANTRLVDATVKTLERTGAERVG
jgi:F0F1-type ATP synthase membrane subunit b/b'